jgi:hypothetical protein
MICGMAKFLEIEFKFPVGPEGEWASFSARAREPLTNIWEIYSVRSHSQAVAPFQTMYLIKELNSWKDREVRQETLLTALVGRAIEKALSSGSAR